MWTPAIGPPVGPGDRSFGTCSGTSTLGRSSISTTEVATARPPSRRSPTSSRGSGPSTSSWLPSERDPPDEGVNRSARRWTHKVPTNDLCLLPQPGFHSYRFLGRSHAMTTTITYTEELDEGRTFSIGPEVEAVLGYTQAQWMADPML